MLTALPGEVTKLCRLNELTDVRTPSCGQTMVVILSRTFLFALCSAYEISSRFKKHSLRNYRGRYARRKHTTRSTEEELNHKHEKVD